MKDIKRNLTMLCDYYELTMSNGYLCSGIKDKIFYFDVFYRQCPDHGGFDIAAGLEQVIDYIKNLHFTAEDIAYPCCYSLHLLTVSCARRRNSLNLVRSCWDRPSGMLDS